MASVAIDTFGTTISIDGVPIPQVQDIDGPGGSTDTDEITNHTSPGGFEEFIATILRSGEVTFPLVFNPANAAHQALDAAWRGKTLDEYVITAPDGSTWTFDGLVTNFGNTYPVNGHWSKATTIKISGEPIFDAAS
jgi:hypothetical protein